MNASGASNGSGAMGASEAIGASTASETIGASEPMRASGTLGVSRASRLREGLMQGAVTPLDTMTAGREIRAGLTPGTGHAGEVRSIYDLPYSISLNMPDYRRLAANTAVLFGGGITALIILQALPDNATAWNSSERERTPMIQRYFDNVMHGPVFDKDDALFNYVLHPYAGAAYYMSARSQGFNMWRSWLYCAAVSTIFWEYGIEAFNELPSIQDLVITPMGGLILGEVFYIAKRYIVENDYKLLGTKWLGYPAAFLLDPVNECLGWFRGNKAHGYSERHPRASAPKSEILPNVTPVKGAGLAYGFSLKVTF